MNDSRQLAAETLLDAAKAVDYAKAGSGCFVFAESCTGGMAGARVTQVPGASRFFHGSMVTYQVHAKHRWLGVSLQCMERHSAESVETTDEMAIRALQKSKAAFWSAAITGHLGPGAEPNDDGVIYLSIATCHQRPAAQIVDRMQVSLACCERDDRQIEAADALIATLADAMQRFAGR